MISNRSTRMWALPLFTLSLAALSEAKDEAMGTTAGQGCVTFRGVIVQDAGGPDACTVISGGGTETAILGGNDCDIEIETRISNWACVGPDAAIKMWQFRYGMFVELPAGISNAPVLACADNADCLALGYDDGCSDTNSDFVLDSCLTAWQISTLPNDLLFDVNACSSSNSSCGSVADNEDPELDNGSEYYAGTIRLHVEPGTTGTVVIPYLGIPFDTFVRLADDTVLGPGDVRNAMIHIPVGRCCGNTCTDNVTPDACVPGTVFEEGLSRPPLTGPGNKCVDKNRYVTVEIIKPSINQSIQLTVVSMPLDPAREGEVWWAGPLTTIPNEPNTDLTGAPALCESTPSTAADWPAGLLHLFGPPIVPDAQYEVRLCDASGENCSAPQTAETGKWGDIVPTFGGPAQPNFADVTALVDKFKKRSFAPDMVRVDLRQTLSAPGDPDTPDHKANFADISSNVDAFKGAGYPYSVPACP